MAKWYYDWICEVFIVVILVLIFNNRNARLLVYPEGHRNPKRGLLTLRLFLVFLNNFFIRTGSFRIAYSKKIPVF
jgi:1-acyl-sn-glycerol-3-phosphate acyltransferase